MYNFLTCPDTNIRNGLVESNMAIALHRPHWPGHRDAKSGLASVTLLDAHREPSAEEIVTPVVHDPGLDYGFVHFALAADSAKGIGEHALGLPAAVRETIARDAHQQHLAEQALVQTVSVLETTTAL